MHILDTTRGLSDQPDRTLQVAIAQALHLPLHDVQAGWLPIDLTETRLPSVRRQPAPSTSAVIQHELERINALLLARRQRLRHSVIVVNEDAQGVNSVAAAFAVQVCLFAKSPPTIVGVQHQKGYWTIVDFISPYEGT